MPAGLQLDRRSARHAAGVTPAEIDRHGVVWRRVAETEMQVAAALPRVAVATVDLCRETAARARAHRCRGADGDPGGEPAGGGMPRSARDGVGARTARRHQQMESEKRARPRRVVAVEGRRFPLIRDREVEIAVAVDVGDRDPARHVRCVPGRRPAAMS